LPKFTVSEHAQSDLRVIARYTLERWGASQAKKYAQVFHGCFQTLAGNSEMGRTCDVISSGLRRHEAGRHVVFYRMKQGGIRIIRVLHQQTIPIKTYFEQ
jgi:toxin ParE1/3/4